MQSTIHRIGDRNRPNMCIALENFTGMVIDKNKQSKTAPSRTAFSPFIQIRNDVFSSDCQCAPSAAVPFQAQSFTMEVLEDTWSDLELARLPAYRCYHHSQGEYENGDVLNFGDVGEISGTCGSPKTAPWSTQ